MIVIAMVCGVVSPHPQPFISGKLFALQNC